MFIWVSVVVLLGSSGRVWFGVFSSVWVSMVWYLGGGLVGI